MSGARVRSLRVAVVSAVLATLCVTCSSANAQKVLNPTSNLTGTATAMSFGLRAGNDSIDGAAPSSSVPVFTSGSVAPDGSVSVPKADLSFPAVSLPDQNGSCQITTCSVTGVTLKLIPAGDAVGNVNPFTGAGALSVPVYGQLDANACAASSCQAVTCQLGSTASPIPLSLTTGTTTDSAGSGFGPITGVAYDEATGALTLVDDTFALPAANCSGGVVAFLAQFLSGSLGLPASAGDAKFAVTLRLDPVLHRGVIAALAPSPISGTAPLTVHFDASGTQVPAGGATYAFDFNGDGVVDQSGSSPTGTITYTAPGVYTARVTVTDRDGDSDTTTRTITVAAPPVLPVPAKQAALPALVGGGPPIVLVRGQTITVSDGQSVTCPSDGPACWASVIATTPGRGAADAAARRRSSPPVRIGQATIQAPTGSTVPVRFQLNARGRTLLRQRHRLRIIVQVALRAGAAQARTFSKTLVISLPKRRR